MIFIYNKTPKTYPKLAPEAPTWGPEGLQHKPKTSPGTPGTREVTGAGSRVYQGHQFLFCFADVAPGILGLAAFALGAELGPISMNFGRILKSCPGLLSSAECR